MCKVTKCLTMRNLSKNLRLLQCIDFNGNLDRWCRVITHSLNDWPMLKLSQLYLETTTAKFGKCMFYRITASKLLFYFLYCSYVIDKVRNVVSKPSLPQSEHSGHWTEESESRDDPGRGVNHAEN